MMAFILDAVGALFVVAAYGVLRARAADGRPVVYGASLVVSAAIGCVAFAALSASPASVVLPLGLPWIGAHFRLDPLSAFFLSVVNLGAVGASLYAIGYGRHETMPERVLPFFPLFLAGLDLVVVADDAFSFLFAWELMSIASWVLVVSDYRSAQAMRAGYVYLLMANLSGLILLLAFGLLTGPAGGYSFATMRAAPPPADIGSLVLLLALLGAGSKAGLIPLHAWLPLAHPAAPSHVSALMSGVMTKVAIYAFIRIAFDLLGISPWWSAVLVLLLGGVTAVFGIVSALMESDLKRLLAFSTVENIGVIFIGLGLAMAFRSVDFAAGEALALTAALFHVFNHATFKSLLFFGAGAVLTATGQRDMENLGGLIRRMPRTGFAFLIGCAAISALPPLNGFVSEWLTFQAILLRPDLPQWGLKIAIPTDGALLALAAALAAACFVKAFGVTFLGRPRSAAASTATEVDGFALAAMLAFAALCALTGLFPGVLIDALAPIAQTLFGARMPVQLGLPWLSVIPVAAARSSYNGLLIFAFVAAATWLTTLGIHRFASRAVRRAPAWDCGFPDPSPATQYSADSFAQPLRRVFGTTVFAARETVLLPPPGDTGAARINKSRRDLIWETLYMPVVGCVGRAADLMNHLQFLTIRRYLAFAFVALVSLLLALTLR
jgi:hydrogenase-4 component B